MEGLLPDTEYAWSVEIGGVPADSGHLRTWAAKAARLSFLVIGDYASLQSPVRPRASCRPSELVARRAAGPDPIRFVLTTGDNIYAWGFGPFRTGSGSDDGDWWPTLLHALRRHASADSVLSHARQSRRQRERRPCRPARLPGQLLLSGRRAAPLLSLSSTPTSPISSRSTQVPSPTPAGLAPHSCRTAYKPHGCAISSRAPPLPGASPTSDHAVFNAGPRHAAENNEDRLKHWLQLFSDNGVKVTFQGHEHNFQASRVNPRSYGIRHFVTGSGGSRRDADVRAKMDSANVAEHGRPSTSSFLSRSAMAACSSRLSASIPSSPSIRKANRSPPNSQSLNPPPVFC